MTAIEITSRGLRSGAADLGHCITMAEVTDVMRRLRTTLNSVLVGKDDVIHCVLACVLARGHLLLEDLPGLGKTSLAKAIARSIQGHFGRIQCTPDLMPSDITGFNMFNQKTHEFEFRRGPVFSDVLLADEINRATPRTQSALFEAMAERQVTIDNHRYDLSPTFVVIATQNPLDNHGAYPLPEAQLDRFAMKLSIGYPPADSEVEMLQAAVTHGRWDRSEISPILDVSLLQQIQDLVMRVEVSSSVQHYLLSLAQRTRSHPRISLGVSPRGLLMWQSLAQAHAFLQERPFVTPDDVQAVARPVLSVRLAGDFESADSLIDELIASESVPV